jgi:hypothetical protein
MNFPFLGRHKDKHISFAKAILMIGFSYFVFQTIISLAEQVANMA